MSFNKYVEKRKQVQEIYIDLESYRENILSRLSGEILSTKKPEKEIFLNTINLERVEKILSKYNFPNTEACVVALIAENVNNISKILDRLKFYADIPEINEIQSEIIQYQRRLILERLDSEDIDVCCENLCAKAHSKLLKVSNYLNEGIQNLKHWDTISIKIKALDQKLNLENAEIIFGDLISGSVEVNISENDEYSFNKIKLENLSNKTKKSILNLFENLESTKKTKILYFHTKINEAKYFNSIIKDLSLGIKTDFPLHMNLYSEPTFIENYMTWKIKVEANNLSLSTNEVNAFQYNFTKQPNILWMEVYEA